MKAVMYHYVRPNTTYPPDYYYLDLEDFRRQLDLLEREYGIMNRETFFDVVFRGRDVPDGGVVLTFDDGLIDHYEYVLPELQSRDHWGIFYVPTGPYQEDELLSVHKIHFLLGEHGGKRVLNTLREVVSKLHIKDSFVDEFNQCAYTDQNNDPATTKVKRILNYYIVSERQSEVLSKLENELSSDTPVVTDFYMNPDHLREMHDAGMMIGSHTITHPVLSKLSQDEQYEEIVGSLEWIEQTLEDTSFQTFCYPYGGSQTFTDYCTSVLDQAGYQCSFNVESRDIIDDDIRQRPHQLPRYDCNEFPYGSASGGM